MLMTMLIGDTATEWNDLLSELESAFESGAEVPCMAVWAQKKRTWVQSLASRLSAALAKV